MRTEYARAATTNAFNISRISASVLKALYAIMKGMSSIICLTESAIPSYNVMPGSALTDSKSGSLLLNVVRNGDAT